MSENNDPAKLVGYVFNWVTNIDDSQQLTISGNLALGASKEEMSAEFDKLRAVTDRLAIRRKIKDLEDKIAQGEAMISSTEDHLKNLQGKTALSQAERVAKENTETSLKAQRITVTRYKLDVEALKKEAA